MTLLDRLLHHADVTVIEGESYRVRESEQETAARRKEAMSGSDALEDRRAYVRAVIEAYVRLPATLARARREDRRLAAELHTRGVPLEVMEMALLLGILRKARPTAEEATPLTTIRSLHYFLPVIEEILRDPPPAPYVDYLREVMTEWPQVSAKPRRRRAPVSAQFKKLRF